MDFEDKPRSGRPQTVEDSAVLDADKEEPEAAIRIVATRLGCTQSTVVGRFLALGCREVLTRWIRRVSTDSMRVTRVSICQFLLLRLPRRESLEGFVAGDENWVLYDSNAHLAVWLLREEPSMEAKSNVHLEKVLLCCFWGSKGMLYYELLPQGRMVTAVVYATQLQKCAKAVQEKQSGDRLHDNARPHVAKATHQEMEEQGWETAPHPPFSHHISPPIITCSAS